MTFWIVVGVGIALYIGYKILKVRKELIEEELNQKTGDWWTCNLLGTKCWYIPFNKFEVIEDKEAKEVK